MRNAGSSGREKTEPERTRGTQRQRGEERGRDSQRGLDAENSERL